MAIFLRFLIILIVVHTANSCSTYIGSPTTASGTRAPKKEYFRPGELIFEENFDAFDLDTWNHAKTMAGGGNWEFQYYNNNRTNSYVEDGNLHIVPTFTADEEDDSWLYTGTMNINGGSPGDHCTDPSWSGCERSMAKDGDIINPIKSALLRSVHSFNYKFGKLEVRAKMPSGDWLWPAIWLMPKNNAYGTWPSSGEIDLIEARGNVELYDRNGIHIGAQQMESTLHFGPRWDLNGFRETNFKRNIDPGYNEDFHKFQMDWRPDSITFSVDDIVLGVVNATTDGGFWQRGQFDTRRPGCDNPWKRNTLMAPFDQEFYIIINLAVGSTMYFDDDLVDDKGEHTKPWRNDSPRARTDFWESREQWLPSWKMGVDDSSHLQVDYVKVWAV